MSEQEKKNCPEYQAGKAAAEWWQSLSEEQRKQMDIVDAFAYGVLYGQQHHHWIPVGERLPEKDNEFEDYSKLVIVTNGKDFWKGMYNYGGEEWLTFDLWPIDDATHWMEIQPPQGKEANND